MSEHFLSFVTGTPQQGSTQDSEAPPGGAANPNQASDFREIFTQEQGGPQGSSLTQDEDAGRTGDPAVAGKSGQDDQADWRADVPFTLPGGDSSGNGLPALSVHSRALSVGRVILTTANPMVSEQSLTEFARSQGINPGSLGGIQQPGQGGLETLGKAETGIPPLSGDASRSQAMLDGLLPESNLRTGPEGESSGRIFNPTNTQRWWQTQGLTPGESTEQKNSTENRVGGMTNPTAPVVNVDAMMNQRRRSLGSDGGRPEPTLEGSKSEIGKESGDMLARLERAESEGKVKQDLQLLSAKIGQGLRDLQLATVSGPSQVTAGEAAAPAEQVNVSAPNPTPSAGLGAPVIMPTAASQAAPASLVDLMAANDPALMQARMQPYQAWADKFGEVLGQKLALAMKQGSWNVRLNLNPASLGPVGINLEVREQSIEGQIAANDANVRQLLTDSLPRLRMALESLYSQAESVNIDLAEQDAGTSGSDSDTKEAEEIEVMLDLTSDVFGSEGVGGGGSDNILRDGLDVFV